MELCGDAHSDQEDFGFRFCRIPIFLSDHLFNLAEPDANGVGHFLFIELVSLLHDGPKAAIAHDHSVNDKGVTKVFDPLFEEAHFFGQRDCSRCLGLNSHDDLEEGRFARAVWAGQAIAAPVVEGEGDIFKKDPTPDLL